MSNDTALQLSYCENRQFHALVLGRAGLDLYPEPDGCKIQDALSFSSDLGGSAGNIAVAISRACAKAGLISALSDDAVGNFVKQRLAKHEYPREIEFISEIPKTTTGKIRRKDLREGRFQA